MKLCTRCNQPPVTVGRGDGCQDPWCPYKRTPTHIEYFPGKEVEKYRKSHNGKLPAEVTDKGYPKFKNVSCSQCGKDFGPGDQGFSRCRDHNKIGFASVEEN